MLKHTFSHLKGISKKRERELWERGVLDWAAYKRGLGEQLTIFGNDEPHHVLSDSEYAYRHGDMAFFKSVIARADFYRIALEFPKDVMFLDIETTGLSLYYDQITVVGWSMGNKFGVYVYGDEEESFIRALQKAKVIVTFNGTLFDMKFIAKHFSNPEFSGVHLDLRYFSKRVGLTGGQKAIERELGIDRDGEIEGMLGEAAPILWHKYRRGDNKALKRLIEYNHADVEGMKAILDESINRYFELDEVPDKLRRSPQFSNCPSRVVWARKQAPRDPYRIYLEDFKGSVKPLITYGNLTKIQPLEELCVIGIDLVSSEERETGYCVLRGKKADTSRLKTDDEMIQQAIASGADLISIDSPLSIPRGRTSYFDDDPQRKFGIMRVCERQMKKRGINSYPALIPSMQKLTRRGVELAAKFRKLGIPVIESYPGAAQDVMSIPRKQAGLQYLTDGIAEFGITGPYTKDPVSHDELDAITSAIVGQFFWAGLYEGLGDEVEDYLIIPDLNADPQSRLDRTTVIISGVIGAGKTTAAQYLEKRNFVSARYSQVLEKQLQEQGKPIIRSNLQQIGGQVHDNEGQRWLGAQLLKQTGDKPFIVIDGVRFREDVSYMRETFGPACMHIHITTSEKARTRRMAGKSREDLDLNMASTSSTEQEVASLGELADIVISNSSTKRTFYDAIDKAMENL